MLEENGEKKEWSEKVTKEKILEHIREKRTLLYNILCRKPNWIDHILRRNWLGVMFGALCYMT